MATIFIPILRHNNTLTQRGLPSLCKLYQWASQLCLILLLSSTVMGQQTFPEVCLTNHAANDRYASYSPDGKSIIFESDRNGSWGIYRMDSNGHNVQALIADSSNNRRPSWHPNGKSILFESDRNGKSTLYWLNLSSNAVEKAIKIAVSKGTPQFGRISPNGQSLVFTLQVGKEVFHQYLYGLKDRSIQLLTPGNYRYAYASWSPDGKKLLMHARHETENQDDEIYIYHLNKRQWKRLTHHPKHNFCPSWSPDGKFIAFAQSMQGSRPEIFVVRKNGKNKRRITWNSDSDTLPNWSPDGKHLLITGYRGNNFEICKIQLR